MQVVSTRAGRGQAISHALKAAVAQLRGDRVGKHTPQLETELATGHLSGSRPEVQQLLLLSHWHPIIVEDLHLGVLCPLLFGDQVQGVQNLRRCSFYQTLKALTLCSTFLHTDKTV